MLLVAALEVTGACRCHHNGHIALTGIGVAYPLVWILPSHRAALSTCSGDISTFITIHGNTTV